MTTTVHKAGTSQEEGPEGRAEDAVKPCLGKAVKPHPLDLVQPDCIDWSPSGTQI